MIFLYNLNNFLFKNKWTLIFGSVLGVTVAVILFYMLPVVSMKGVIVEKDSNSVTVHVWGEKYRGGCKFLGISGYTLKDGLMSDASAIRIDKPELGRTRPKGYFDIGKWLIYPLGDSERALMYVMHSCGPGDVRMTNIADVNLE